MVSGRWGEGIFELFRGFAVGGGLAGLRTVARGQLLARFSF